MNLPDILNVAIGLVLLFFLLSSAASLLLDLVTNAVRYREEILYVSINRLLVGEDDQPWNILTLALDRIADRLPPGDGPLGVWAWYRRHWDKPYAIGEVAGDRQVAEKTALLRRFWHHPKIRSLATVGADAPPAVDPSTFAQVLVDVAIPRGAQGELPDNRLALERVLGAPNHETPECLLRTLRSLALSSEIPPGATGETLWLPFRANIAAWFNEASAQSSAFYKRTMQRLLLCAGAALALICNADALRTVHVLAHNRTLREAAAAYAATVTAEQEAAAKLAAQPTAATPPNETARLTALSDTRVKLGQDLERLRDLEQIGFPIGWAARDGGFHHGAEWLNWVKQQELAPAWLGLAAVALALLVLKIIGLGITTLAVAQGAPFWYDLMQRLIGLRKGVAPDAAAPPAKPVTATDNVSPNGKVAAPTALPLEIGYDLASPATGFSARKAYWLARAAAAAYSPRREIESLVLQTWRFHRFEFFDANGTQGFLAADDKIVLVAFRGTELGELQDLLADAHATFTPFGDGKRRVHTGFSRAIDFVWAKLEEQVVGFIHPEGGAADAPRQVFITGHSLGGALATLMFARLMLQGERPVPTLYTFGCPRVGDSAFAGELDRRYPERIHRIVNGLDIVPELPPSAEYHHAGELLSFEANDGIRTEVSGLSRLLGHAARVAATDLRQATRDALDAHGVAHYVARCERLVKTI